MRIRRKLRRAVPLAPERGRLAMAGFGRFPSGRAMPTPPSRMRTPERLAAPLPVPHGSQPNLLYSSRGGVDQPQIRGRGQRSKPGCLRQRLDPQRSRYGGLHANEIFGRHRISRTVVESRACFRFDDLELPECRVAKSEEAIEGIRAGNAFPAAKPLLPQQLASVAWKRATRGHRRAVGLSHFKMSRRA